MLQLWCLEAVHFRTFLEVAIPDRRSPTLAGQIVTQEFHEIVRRLLFRRNSEEANVLKIDGEPGRTRTYNPLIKSQLLYH
jgi:hypothetical protein